MTLWKDQHILNPKKVNSVMGCELSRQLSEPGICCCASIIIVLY